MHHITTTMFGQEVHADTLYFAWACMAFILIVALFLVSGLRADATKYNSRQFVAESIYSFIRGLCRSQIGKHGDKFVFFIGSIFIFIATSYYAGLLPWKMGALFSWWPEISHHAAHGEHVAHAAAEPFWANAWHGASPCADLNVPAGMAVIALIVYLLSGALVGGWAYIQMFLPINFSKKGITLNPICLIELMDLIVRPLTLTLRLFANTVAGETLLATFIGMVALFLPVAILGFELFVGVLQAFIFTILTTVYIGGAIQHAEHLLHEEAH